METQSQTTPFKMKRILKQARKMEIFKLRYQALYRTKQINLIE